MEKDTQKYLNTITKIIRTDNPKFISYISREYMSHRNTSPIISDYIHDTILAQTRKNAKSPYSIFIKKNGTIDIENISDISKITNLPEFISQVERLSGLNIDFSQMTADDLIIEGNKIAEEIEQELQKELEKEDASDSDYSDAESKSDNALKKVGILAIMGGVFASAINRIKNIIGKIKSKKNEVNKEGGDEEKKREIKIKKTIYSSVPKVEIDEQQVIKNMNHSKNDNAKNKNTDTYGDGDPDGDDIGL